MFTVKGEHYRNDYTRSNFTKTFNSLQEIFEWGKKVSENFTSNYGSYFPRLDIPDYVGRISFRDENNKGYEYWIYQIEIQEGIIFSTGKYTASKPFCSPTVKSWCAECTEQIKNIRNQPNFINF